MNRYYPSRRAVAAVALGMPLSLAAGLVAPALWAAGVIWSLAAIMVVFADAFLGAHVRKLTVAAALPEQLGLGRTAQVEFSLAFAGAPPRSAELELETNARLDASPQRLTWRRGKPPRFLLTPLRRGNGRLEKLWLRWTGPLGLAWIQKTELLARDLPIFPDIQGVREEASRLFNRDTDLGLHSRLNRGTGAEFHALRDYQHGHDPRQIDWKQSARHNALIVKEFRVEQNQHIVVALDTGRLMSALLLGQPRLDRALHAILLLAYVGLKLGDRVGLFAFDSRPRLSSGTVFGLSGFSQLQRMAAGLDYSTEETNFTLGLTHLANELERSSTVILFTDFADTTSAELMLENVARLLRRHTIIFVVFRDEELEQMRTNEPRSSQDASRAVIADMMLKERDVVLARLRQMGVDVIDAPVRTMNAKLIDAYLAMKQRAGAQP